MSLLINYGLYDAEYLLIIGELLKSMDLIQSMLLVHLK